MYARALLACLRSACLPAQLLSFLFSSSFFLFLFPRAATPRCPALLQVQYWIILLQRSSTNTSCLVLSFSLNCAPATSASATVLAKHNDVPRKLTKKRFHRGRALHKLAWKDEARSARNLKDSGPHCSNRPAISFSSSG